MTEKYKVVCANTLIDASHTLNLIELRLMMLAIAKARHEEKGVDLDSLLVIRASDYAAQYGVDISNTYPTLKAAAKSMFMRYVAFEHINRETNKIINFNVHWFSVIGYEPDSGFIYLRFSQELAPQIMRLYSHFTSFDLDQIAKLTSGYAILLYQFAAKHRFRNQYRIDPLPLEKIREIFKIEPQQYKTMSNFKRHVLDIAVEQVNKHTDIKITYENIKDGRTITGIKLKCSSKKLRVVGAFTLSEAQLRLFVPKISAFPEIQKLAITGESQSDFEARIAKKINDPDEQEKYRPFLVQAGFNF